LNLENKEKKAAPEKKLSMETILASLFAALIIGALGVSIIREYSSEHYIVQKVAETQICLDENIVGEWLNSVESGNAEKAILLAKRIIPDVPELPNPEYIKLFLSNKLYSCALTDTFCKVDFLRWKDALELKKLAESICKNRENATEELFNAIEQHVKPPENPEKQSVHLNVMDIWNSGVGNDMDKVRLLHGLAEQLGMDVKIIGFTKNSGIPLMYLCEVHDPVKDKYDVIDIATNKIIRNKSIKDLILNDKSVPPEFSGVFKKALHENLLFIQPSEFQDYRVFNIKLGQALSKTANPKLPVFGKDPSVSIEKYCKKMKGLPNEMNYGYWQVPVNTIFSSSDIDPKWTDKKILSKKTDIDIEKK